MISRGVLGLVSPRARRAIALSWGALFILSLLLQYANFALAPAALAVHDEGLFELDGNAVNQAAAGNDWDQVFNGTSSAEATKFITDPVDNQTDPSFTGGSTKDDIDITSWLWKHAKVGQPKNDIVHAFAAAYTPTSGDSAGDSIVYFGLDKFEADGDNFVGFWFLRGAVGPTGSGKAPGSHFSGAHSVGDVLVLADYTNGGAIATFSVYKWVASGGDAGAHLKKFATGVPCTGAPATDDACGATNKDTVAAPWPFDGRDGGPGEFPAGTFFEGGINLSNLGLDKGCFTSFIAETRSSQSVSATLSDFASGTFSFCKPPTIATKVSDSEINAGGSVTDTATLSGTKGPASGTVDFFVCGPTGAAKACTTGGTQVGGSVAVATSSTGGTATSAAFSPTAAGFYCFRAEYTPDADALYLAGSHTNATSECIQVHGAGVAVTKTANPAGPVSAGDEVGFDITVTSTGDGSVTGVSMSDVLPDGISWTADAPTGDTSGVSCSIEAGTLTCSDESMATGESFTVHVSGTTDPADCGTIENTATVDSTNDGSGKASASVDVLCPDVKVDKSAASPVVKVGGTATFHITVSNIGDGIARDVVVTDELPGGLDWQTDQNGCSIDGATLTCKLGDLAPDESVTITVSANTDTPAPQSSDCGPLDNTAVAVSSNEPGDALDNNSDSATIDVTCTSALVITKSFTGNTGGTDPDLGVPAAKIGDTLHYSLKYTGAGTLTNAVITDTLPAGLAYVDGSAVANADFNAGTYDSTTRTITWHAKGVLPDPASGTVTYDVKVLATAPDFAQPLVNLATIKSDETPLSQDTASVAVLAPPLELTPPPTSTLTPETGTSNPGFALMLVLLGIAGLALAIGFVTPVPARVRRRDRLG